MGGESITKKELVNWDDHDSCPIELGLGREE